MLNLPIKQNFTKLKLGPAVKLLDLVEKLKLYYFKNYVKSVEFKNNNEDNNNNNNSDGTSETNETNNMEVDANNESSCDDQNETDENFSRLD
jgi:hypothetical protein